MQERWERVRWEKGGIAGEAVGEGETGKLTESVVTNAEPLIIGGGGAVVRPIPRPTLHAVR